MKRLFLIHMLSALLASAQELPYHHHTKDSNNVVEASGSKVAFFDTLQLCNLSHMLQIYQSKSFSLDSIRKYKTVPAIHAESFPSELKAAKFAHKKHVFIGVVLTSILKANAKVLEERAEIIKLHAQCTLSPLDSIRLAFYKKRYYASDFEELFDKVDILPPSLVIAQGINESGWGTSFFAREANSIFGLKAPKKSSLPTLKHPRTSFKTYKFYSLDEGVEEYLLNMNRHRLYKPLRDIRSLKRDKGLTITGKALLPGMKRYSSRGSAYLRTVRELINMYQLEDFDTCMLEDSKGLFLMF